MPANLKKNLFLMITLFFFSIIRCSAQYTPAPPRRFDFEAPHKDTVYVNITGGPYTPAAPRRFDFQALHKDTVYINRTGAPYTPGPPRRFDFEAPHRQTKH